ncbi:MAG: hypothetical protein E7576_11240 [Ruminococcaceae bacterium]|nr:hypothetical protein [Oscillospiraceae bacterium]
MHYLRRFTSHDELVSAIERYPDFYNNRSYLFRLKCMTPMGFHRAAV